jgi:hypothetical protein
MPRGGLGHGLNRLSEPTSHAAPGAILVKGETTFNCDIITWLPGGGEPKSQGFAEH